MQRIGKIAKGLSDLPLPRLRTDFSGGLGMGGLDQPTPRRTTPKHKKKSKQQYAIIGGKAYTLAGAAKKKSKKKGGGDNSIMGDFDLGL